MKTRISFWLVIPLICCFFKYQDSYAACPNVTPSFSTSTSEVCGPGPATITFINSSTGTNSGASGYQWYLNGTLFANTTGVFASPSSTISGYGVYNYMMVVFDSIGFCHDTSYQIVRIVQKPVADFFFVGDTFCPNIAVNFTNSSTNTIGSTYYRWGFDGGGSSSAINPIHSFGVGGGSRNVSLIALNTSGCSDTMVKSLFILPTPIIDVGGDDGNGDLVNCLAPFDTVTRELVQFFNNSPGGVTYTWDFDDGSAPVVQSYTTAPDTISHLFTSFGTFNVICSAIDTNGCLYTDTLVVIFDKYISASFTVPIVQISGCTPHFVQPTNASVNAARYRWNFGDGSPVVTTNSYTAPSHVYTSTGNYTITLIASNDCNTSTSTVGPIVVNETPLLSFLPSLVGRGCAPESITFTNTSQYIAPTNNFSWDMGNGNTYIGVDPPAQIYDTGIYTVTLIGGNGCGNDTVEETYTIDSLPKAIFSRGPIVGCSPLIVNASAVAFGYNTYAAWSVDGIAVGSADTLPAQIFNNSSTAIQTHTVRYVLSNHCGSFDTSFVVTVHPEVQASLNSTSNPICFGNSLNHISMSTGSSLTFSWLFGDGTSSSTVGPHSKTYNKTGLDSVKLVVTGYCGVDSTTKFITVDSIPYASSWVSPLEGCSPLIVTGNSVPTGAGTSTTWSHNSTTISTTDSLYSYAFYNSGTALLFDSVVFQISNHCGVFDTLFDVVIHPDVNAEISPTNALICAGDSVVFSNLSSGDSLTYLWKFGNGDTTSAVGPHQRGFGNGGNDTTWFIADGFCGVDSISSIITINPYPVAKIINSVDSGCKDLPVNFNNGAPNGATSYSWVFNNGTPSSSTLYNPSVLFSVAGQQQVTLEVDSLGCLSYDTVVIKVFPGPDPQFSYSPISGCSELAVTITNNSPVLAGDKYLWKFENGDTSTLYNPPLQSFKNSSHLFDSVYFLELVIYTRNGCNDSLSQSIRVHPIPKSLFGVSDTVFCEKEIVVFSDSSIGASSYKWYFGDGDSSSVSNPAHSYDTAGIYTATLITTSFWNCKDTSYRSVRINPNPRVIFYFDTACLTYSTTFTDSTLFGPTTWNWNFGDGISSSAQHPIHLYLKDSSYPVTLVVSNNFGCVDSINQFVDVYRSPDAGFMLSTACAKIPTQFTDTSVGNPKNWKWFFGDGDSSFLQNPSHIYSVGGTYNVQLIVQNSVGCLDTLTKSIVISTVPGTYFIADTVCLGSPTFFNDSTALSYPVFSRLWDFGNGNSSTQINPTYQFLTPGTYVVSLTITNSNGCDSTYTDTAVVLPVPLASFSYDTVCFGDSIQFSNSSVGMQYSVWDYGDGSPLDTNLSSVIHHTYSNDGAYLVLLKTVNSHGCVDSVSHIVFVRPNPIANYRMLKDSVCLNSPSGFLNTSIGGINYTWSFGDGNSSNQMHPIHVYSNANQFVVTLMSTNVFGCVDSVSDTVYVLNNPVSSYSVDTVCLNQSTSFINQSIGLPLSSRWSFGDGLGDTTTNPIHLYINSGSYNSKLIVTNVYGCSDTVVQSVVVHPAPTGYFSYTKACETRPVYFSDSSLGNPVSWNWDFGDGNIDSVQNPVHTYSDSGTFLVTLIIRNSQGCMDTIVKPIRVFTIPIPDFDVDTVCLGNPAVFINQSVFNQPISTYFWDFGDGNSSYGINPNYIYGASGLYWVTLTVTNIGGCDSSVSKSVYVRPVPVADYIYDSVCAGLPTTFTDISAGSPISWKWNFGDFSAIDSSGPIVQHIYSSAGTYTTSLLVKSGSSGCTSQTVKFVTVFSGVSASFNFGKPICDGSAVQFVNNTTIGSGAISSSNWTFGDGGTSTLLNPSYLYSGPGVYQVTLDVVSSLGCAGKDSMMLLVNPKPVVNFGFVSNICVGNPTPFYDSSTISTGAIKAWRWNFGDGGVDSVKNPAHTYITSGTYSVNLQVTSDSGCVEIGSKLIHMNPESDVSFTYSAVCVGDSIQFTDLTIIATHDSIISWFWDFGDGNTSTVQNPKHAYSSNTQSYLVKLTVLSGLGCYNDTTILVSHLPVPKFNYGPEFFGYCENELIQFYDSSLIDVPAVIVGWEWEFGCGHKSFVQNPTHAIDSAGSYTVKLKFTTSDGCVLYDSIAAPLVIYPNPTAAFEPVPSVVSIFRPEVYFNNLSTGALNYVWDFGDGSPSSNLTFPIHQFPKVVGFYTVKQVAYSDFGCTDSTTRVIYVKDEFTMYAPNSFTPYKEFNKVFLVRGYNVSNFHLKIFNRWGELIFETTDINEGWDGKNNGKDCPVGAYIYQIEARDNEGNDHSKTGHVTLVK